MKTSENIKTSEFEERIGIINKFIDINSPGKMFGDHDVKETYSKPEDFVTGTIEELINYASSSYNPPSKNRSEWKIGEKYLLCPVDKVYFENILKTTGCGFIFYLEIDTSTKFSSSSSVNLELKSQPIYVIEKE